jgi:hypothetical protein
MVFVSFLCAAGLLTWSYFTPSINLLVMCMYYRKSWQEKLTGHDQLQVKKADKDFAGIHAGQLMLIPTPVVVDAYIRQIPRGTSVSMDTLRRDLALEHGAEVACPLTTGMFVRIVAEAAFEAYENGTPLEEITPFWRVIEEASPMAQKLSFGTDFLIEQRRAERLLKPRRARTSRVF